MKFISTVVALLLVCLVHNSNAIKCYRCKSLTDPNCAKEMIDASSNVQQVDCDNVPKPNTMEVVLPVKKCNKVTTSDKAGKIVSRDCHFEVVGQKDNECSVTHSTQVEKCYVCTGDLCNASSAGRLMMMGALTMLIAVASIISI